MGQGRRQFGIRDRAGRLQSIALRQHTKIVELEANHSAILIQKASCRSSAHSSMAVDGQVVFHEDFPDPAEQAEALLETCQGDVCEAQGIAATNLRFSKCEADRIYWSRVEILILRQEQSTVVERLEKNKLKRKAATMPVHY